MTIKHSKYKNTGILFELLIRQIASDVLSGTKNSKAIPIVETYFSKNRELGKELVLYRSIFGGKKLTESKALDYINVLIEQRKILNTKKLKEEKYNLIKEIKENYDLNKFLSNRVPSYKIYASIYKNFECAAQGYTFENVQELSESKYTLVEYLCGEIENKKVVVESEVVQTIRELEEDKRLLTYKFLLEKFNVKYKNLNENQKTLLKEFLNKGSDRKYLLELIKSKANELIESLSSKSNNVEDDVQKIKLHEVIKQLNEFQSLNHAKNNHFTALMIAYELDGQLDNFQHHD